MAPIGRTLQYHYKEAFEPLAGYRFSRNKRSLLLGATATGQKLTNEQNISFTKASDAYFDSLQGREPRQIKIERLLSESDFQTPCDAPLYKYVSEETWHHIQRGSFRLGSAVYYRTTENHGIRDDREGCGYFFIQSNDDQFSLGLTSGFNAAIFCGTALPHADVDHEVMIGKFGSRLLKIEPVNEFIERLRKRIHAFRARVFDITYTDTKTIIVQHERGTRLRQLMRERPNLHELNREYFQTFYDLSLLPTLCAKPSFYAEEHERRAIFEMRDDLTQPAIIVNDKSLLDFVSVVD
ncbi:MAG TPA: hypothetical protein VMI56_22000 [Reyranella sp.]|nr:hypothetical protein [Reyranella sp.]